MTLTTTITAASTRPLKQLPRQIQENLRNEFPIPNIPQARADFFQGRGVYPGISTESELQQAQQEWSTLFTRFVKQEKKHTQPYRLRES